MQTSIHSPASDPDHVRYGIGACSLGQVLVATRAGGVCAIAMGDRDDALVADLGRRFSPAHIERADRALAAAVADVVALIEDPRRPVDVALDPRGSAFQQRVWSALRAIPVGQTLSYAELARRIGAPRGARAVAGACAANPLAVVVPCHRVVRGDGGVSGYRWGVERKRILLRREAAA